MSIICRKKTVLIIHISTLSASLPPKFLETAKISNILSHKSSKSQKLQCKLHILKYLYDQKYFVRLGLHIFIAEYSIYGPYRV